MTTDRKTHIRFRMGSALLTLAVLHSAALAQEEEFSGSSVTRFSLVRAMATALENNPTLQEARLSVSIADEQVREAWSNVLPRLSTNASYSRSIIKQSIFLPAAFFDTSAARTDEQIAVEVGSDNVWGAGVTISQPAFHMGAFIGVGASGRVRKLQAELLRGTTQQVMTRVRQAYLNALLSSEEVQLTEKSLERVRRSLEEAQALNRSGMVSEYDVLRLEVQVSNLESDFHRAKTNGQVARRNLLMELGLPPEQNISLEGRLSDLDLQGRDNNTVANAVLLDEIGFADDGAVQFQQVYDRALENRSDLRQIEISIELEEARLAAQRAEYFPTLSLFYNYNLAAQENLAPDFFGEHANQRSEFGVAGISVEVPLFRGFARNARLQQQRIALRQVEIRLRNQKRQAETEVRTLLSNLEDTLYRGETHRRAVEQARRGYEIATAQYRTGVGSQLQVSDAEVALRQSEFNYSRTIHDYLSIRAQLDAAVGSVPASLEELN